MPAFLVLGGLSLAAGFAGSKSAKKDRRAALAMQRESLDFAKQRYNDYKTLYGDLEKQLVTDAKAGVKADIPGVTTRAVGDVAGQFQGAQQGLARQMGRYGINPGSAQFIAATGDLGLKKATATATLVNQNREAERKRAEDQTWARRRDVTGLGVSQMTGAANSVSGAMGDIANTYSQSASDKMAQANAAFGGAGTMIGLGLGQRTGAPAKTPSGDAIPPGGGGVASPQQNLNPGTPEMPLWYKPAA